MTVSLSVPTIDLCLFVISDKRRGRGLTTEGRASHVSFRQYSDTFQLYSTVEYGRNDGTYCRSVRASRHQPMPPHIGLANTYATEETMWAQVGLTIWANILMHVLAHW